MTTNRVIHRTEEGPGFEFNLLEWVADMGPGESLERLTVAKTITHRQRAWFKGVLLPSLAKHTGDSTEYWETTLKLAVLPDEFEPYPVAVGRKVKYIVPSITKLGKAKMNKLIDGSIAHLHEEKIYGGEFLWVTDPDPELRR